MAQQRLSRSGQALKLLRAALTATEIGKLDFAEKHLASQ